VPAEKTHTKIKARSNTKEKMVENPCIGELIILKLFMIQINIPTRIKAKNFMPAMVKIIECRSAIVNK
jgi:hypothetical protein